MGQPCGKDGLGAQVGWLIPFDFFFWKGEALGLLDWDMGSGQYPSPSTLRLWRSSFIITGIAFSCSSSLGWKGGWFFFDSSSICF